MTGPLSFAEIRPLIARVAVDGRAITATFRCPVSGIEVRSAWSAPPPRAGAGLGGPLRGVRSQVHGMIRDLLGYGPAGRAARSLADATLGAPLTGAEEEHGLVEAFRAVAFRFARQDGRWVHGSVLGQQPDPLQQAVDEGPQLTPYDRDVAARMVVAVARAQGEPISDDERLHLMELFDGRGDSLERLLARPPLTRAELAETTRGPARRVILGVAWSMALCDEDFDAAERAVLEDFAAGLGLGLEARVEVQRQAQAHVLDQYLQRMRTWGEHDQASRDAFLALAARIGVSEGAARRAEARFLSRTAGEGSGSGAGTATLADSE